jgi:thioester reductase-like protein
LKTGRQLIHISTASVAGTLPPTQAVKTVFDEKMLWFGQGLDNLYTHSKFMAERAVLDAMTTSKPLDAKIMRLGNLMSRASDGEFQINFASNGFMRQLRGYQTIGKFPVSMSGAAIEFSPIDSTAQAILRLASADGNVFHAFNNHVIYMADAIDAMNRHGFKIRVVSDAEFDQTLRNSAQTEATAGLIVYDQNEPLVEVSSSNAFTTESLYRLGFKWPMTSENYLENAIEVLDEFGFFDTQ